MTTLNVTSDTLAARDADTSFTSNVANVDSVSYAYWVYAQWDSTDGSATMQLQTADVTETNWCDLLNEPFPVTTGDGHKQWTVKTDEAAGPRFRLKYDNTDNTAGTILVKIRRKKVR